MTKLLLSLLFFVSIPGWLTYTDKVNKFTMEYPQDWTRSESAAVAFLSAREDANDKFQENVNVLVQDLSANNYTFQQFTDLSISQIKAVAGDSAILSGKTITFAGQPAEDISFFLTMQGLKLKIKQYWFLKDKKAYVLTYTAEPTKFSKFEDTALKIMKSFKFTGQ